MLNRFRTLRLAHNIYTRHDEGFKTLLREHIRDYAILRAANQHDKEVAVEIKRLEEARANQRRLTIPKDAKHKFAVAAMEGAVGGIASADKHEEDRVAAAEQEALTEILQKMALDRHPPGFKEVPLEWDCIHCTFTNTQHLDLNDCTMCGMPN